MQQPRLKSRLEAAVVIVCGHTAAVAVFVLIFPAFGLSGTMAVAFRAGVWFALLGLARSVSSHRGVLKGQRGVAT